VRDFSLSLAELDLSLHERHAFGNDDQRKIAFPQIASDLIHRGGVNTIDLYRQPVYSIGSSQFAFMCMESSEQEVQLLQERSIAGIGPDPRDSFTGEPVPLFIRVKNLGVAAFNFDDNCGDVGHFELAAMIRRPALHEIPDVDILRFHFLRRWTGAAIRLNSVQVDVGILATGCAVGISSNL